MSTTELDPQPSDWDTSSSAEAGPAGGALASALDDPLAALSGLQRQPALSAGSDLAAAPDIRGSLAPDSREIYRTLLSRGLLEASEIQEVTGLRASEVRSGLGQLERLGLISSSSHGYRAVHYRTVVDGLLRSQASILERVLTHLSERHQTLQTLIAERDALEPSGEVSTIPLVTGPRDSMYEMPSQPTTEIATIHPGSQFSDDLLDRSLARAEESLHNGIALRVIHQRSLVQRPRQLAYLREIEEMGGRVRLRDNLPFRLLLIDRASAVCALNADEGTPETLLLRDSKFVAMLVRVFEVTWIDSVSLAAATGRSAAPERSQVAEGLTSLQETLLRMLAEGQTDQAIARKLGITTRTVTRRMGEIYETLGVNNRFQAGLRAQRLGLV